MHPEYDKIYDYSISITLTNEAFFVYRQTGEQNRVLHNAIEYMDSNSREGNAPLFIGFFTQSGRYVAVNYARIRHIRLLYEPKAGRMQQQGYDDHFGIRETDRRTKEQLAHDERQHRINQAEKAGHPNDPMPDEEAEEAEAFLETMDIDLEAELPGVAITPTTIEPDEDIPDVIVYTAYPTTHSNAENELAKNSYFYYDQEPGTLYNLDAELEHGEGQRKFLCLYDDDGDLDCIPMDAIWLMEMSREMLDPTNVDLGIWELGEEEEVEGEEDVEVEDEDEEDPFEKRKDKPGKNEDMDLPF